MFARRLSVFMSGGTLATTAAMVLIFGSACKDSDEPICAPSNACEFVVAVSGAQVIPTPAPADTSARAWVTFDANTFAYTYTVQVAPAGTIDSIALYEVSYKDPLPASAIAIFCAGAAACAATSGTGRVVPAAMAAMIAPLMRAYGTALVVFTTTAQKAAGGAMRGIPYLGP